jgi:phospholipase C
MLHPVRLRFFAALVCCGLLAAPLTGDALTISPPAPPTTLLPGGGFQPPSTTPIKHVIIVVMENRTFDNVFSGFPGADTVSAGKAHDGTMIPLATVPFYGLCDPDHSHGAWLTQWDGGKMDGFDLVAPGCIGTTKTGAYNYAHLPLAAVEPYWNLATQFSVADRMFASQRGPSYPGHLYLFAGTSGNQIDDPNALEWGCDAPAGTTVETLDDSGNVAAPQFPCLNVPSMGQLLDSYAIPWAYYSNNLDYNLTGKKTEISTDPLDAISYIRNTSLFAQHNLSGGVGAEFAALLDGTLPTVSWFNPPVIGSDHAQTSTNIGPQYVSLLSDILMTSKYWNDTALFVTWDDAGGWYDHVSPPVLDGNGLGFRVPLILVSKWAKRGYVSHVQHEYGSLLKFIEEDFNLPSLGTTDLRSDDLRDMFDFSGATSSAVTAKTPLAMALRFAQAHPSPHPASLVLPKLVKSDVPLSTFLQLGPDTQPLDDDGAPMSPLTAAAERR